LALRAMTLPEDFSVNEAMSPDLLLNSTRSTSASATL